MKYGEIIKFVEYQLEKGNLSLQGFSKIIGIPEEELSKHLFTKEPAGTSEIMSVHDLSRIMKRFGFTLSHVAREYDTHKEFKKIKPNLQTLNCVKSKK